MDDVIKGVILENGSILISVIEEIFTEPGEPDCRLLNPYLYRDNDLVKWLEITDQTEVNMHSRNILTIVDPTEEIIQKYIKLITE